jgi:uncharacterized membrane protein YfcA
MAVIGAFIGAQLLLQLSNNIVLYSYAIGSKTFLVTPVKLIIALLIIIFALFDSVPRLKNIQFSENKLYPGGLISGFFGGLSGNQGALRSMFLLRCGLSKDGFIATGILIACAVDLTRLSVYFTRLSSINIQNNFTLLISTIASAFAGAYLGSKLLKKITLHIVQYTVTVMIILLACGLASGLL